MYILLLGPACTRIEEALLNAGHRVFRTEEPITVSLLAKHAFDFGISYRYRHIIRQPEIDYFTGKLINLHISYLPWNKGSDPNLWSWLDDTPKGVSIHMIDAGCDTGDILVQKTVAFNPHTETLQSSYHTLCQEIEMLFLDNMRAILTQTCQAQKQIGKGSYHYAQDKSPYLHLLRKKGWETAVTDLCKNAKDIQ